MSTLDETNRPEDASLDQTVDSSRVAGPGPGHPTRIGGYTIRRVIASGGMGTVYEAMQESPRRPAAVKVVKRSMASAEGLRRFEREAQALARLRHPGIAQIYEAGTYEDQGVRLPFFALEYVANARTIIDYAKAKDLGVRTKLDLFIQVCEAAHYGHQRGIIHRDLKPANILVDSEGRVRIIDFGVARAVDADLEQVDAQTRVGQIIGTAQYMSPEQFEADPNDIDTRSDIYALGVVLFELLAGRLPYDFEKSGIFEIARIVREEAPAALSGVAPGIEKDVELIVAKALNKDREKRYQSAFGLAEDIRRYLKGEAIAARTTSLTYQARIFTRRNKGVVGLGAAVAVLLVAGIVWTSNLYVGVSAERTRAAKAAAEAIAAKEFLTETLKSVVPEGFGPAATIGDLCDKVVRDIDGAFPDSPATEADIRTTVGQIYVALDRPGEAEIQLRKAYDLRNRVFGRTDTTTLDALGELNFYYQIFGPNDRNLETMTEIHDTAQELFGPEDEKTLDAKDELIGALDRAGDYREAERKATEYCGLIEKKFGADSIQMANAKLDLALRQFRMGRLDEALVTAQAVHRWYQNYEDATPEQLESVHEVYAIALLTAGRIDEAKELYGHKKAPESLGIVATYQPAPDLPPGDIRIVVFFETWCPFCLRYMPSVEGVNRQYRDHGVEIIGLTGAWGDTPDGKVHKYITDNEMTFGVFKESGRLRNYFGFGGVPSTVILHDGEVVLKTEGANRIDMRMIEGLVSAN
ncbi:MAG: protein kinase [bacterium]